MQHSKLSLPTSIFCAAAPSDNALLAQWEKHLLPLTQVGQIIIRSERHLMAGADRTKQLYEYLDQAQMIVFLLSADFFASDECMTLMHQALAGQAQVIPLIIRPCVWQHSPLASLAYLPPDGIPITSCDKPEEAFQVCSQKIQAVVEVLNRHVVLVSAAFHQTFTTRLTHYLSRHGIPLWQEAGIPEPTRLKNAIREASVVVMITSSETISTHTLKEARRFSDMYQRPMVGVWIPKAKQGNKQPDASILYGKRWIDAGSGRGDLAFQEIHHSLNSYRQSIPSSSPFPIQEDGAPNQEPRNPYKGLQAFGAADAGDFFGRVSVIEALLTSVETILTLERQGQPQARLLAVVGASGSGKSSVVRAGFLPALQSGQIFDSKSWIYLAPIVPGEHPLDALVLALFEYFPGITLTKFREDLLNEPMLGLHLYATALARRRDSTRVVLVVDQFEEIFTLTTSEQERQSFFDLLVTACTQPDGPLMVVLTLRADFYDRPMQYPVLYTLIAGHQTPLLPMKLPDLRAVITEPAKLPDVKLSFEENLVGDMLFDVQGQIGALPLLQFTLDQLFTRRDGHRLTMRAYQEIGGVKGALLKQAEETYLALPSEKHRELTRMLFLRLVDPGTTEQDTTRRRATLTEMVLVDPEQTRLMQETMDRFVKARLLTTNANAGTEMTIEVSHEALIREWLRLVDWLRTAREDIRLQHIISEDAAAWERNRRKSDRLYRGTQFKEARTWATRNTMNRQEQAFLHASAARQRFAFIAILSVFLLVIGSSGIAGWIALHQPPQPPKAGYVTTTDEYAVGSLRWAIGNAHAGDTITFAPSMIGQTFILRNADVHLIQQNLTILGPATGHITIRGIGASFFVDKPASVTLSGLAFQGSHGPDQSSLLINEGKLTLIHCTVSGNSIHNDGGGIANSGTLTMTNSAVTGNSTSFGSGGGIANSGTLTMTNSAVTGNTASGGCGGGGGGYYYNDGGGISNDGSLTMTNSIVTGNTASVYGGGISNYRSLTMINSTVTGNTASSGGGIWNYDTLTMTNTTISGNTASGCRAPSSGGGISSNGTLTVTNSTITGNTASDDGGGIFNQPSDPNRMSYVLLVVDIAFSTIVSNTASGNAGYDITNSADPDTQLPLHLSLGASIVGGDDTQHNPIAGVITSRGYNVIQHMSPANFDRSTAHVTDLSVDDLTGVVGAHPQLHNNGGSTQTYQLVPGTTNPALDRVPSNACTDSDGKLVITDERGMPRPGKNKQRCDSGAYESQH